MNNVTGCTAYKCLAENVVGADDATCIITVVNRGKSHTASLELNILYFIYIGQLKV